MVDTNFILAASPPPLEFTSSWSFFISSAFFALSAFSFSIAAFLSFLSFPLSSQSALTFCFVFFVGYFLQFPYRF
jgi:hypothetical protein